jgi:zinc transporter 1/2/3
VSSGLAGFALGATLQQAGGLSPGARLGLGLGFAAATPLGVAIGAALGATLEAGVDGPVPAALTAVAAGSFCYVGLLEVLPRELAKRGLPKGGQVASLLLGVGLMAAVAVWV